MKFPGSLIVLALAVSIPAATCASAQTAPAPTTPAADPQQPHGTVLFQSHGTPPEADADRQPLTAATPAAPEIPDRERAAIGITTYDLEAHLNPATAELNVHAILTVRNDSPEPATHLPLQLSSTLQWESAAIVAAGKRTELPLAEHLLDTDTDHTGRATELVLTLPHPLAPGATLTLDTFYSGLIPLAADRLTRIGASATQAAGTDWDTIDPTGTLLRGFGNVLWYPVASPPFFLGEGAKLFDALGVAKLRDQQTSARLRLSVEYTGAPPVTAWFCGRRQPLTAVSDNSSAPDASTGGIATADFPLAPVGFRALNLFLLADKELPAPPAPLDPNESSSASEEAPLLAISTSDDHSVARLLALSSEVSPLLTDWLGPHPLTALTILNNSGQAFEDGPLLVAPIDSLASSDAASAMAHSLTHAWVNTGQPWIDEGLAQFLAIEWVERTLGREAAIGQLQALTAPLALGEPSYASAAALAAAPPGQPLINTSSEVFYRRKAAAVWFMLREIVGEASLKAALTTLREQPVSTASPADQALAFRKLLESLSHKDLAAFFNDWVLHDNGLPDLNIVDVTPRQLPAGKGHDSGWLTAITVRNDGAAVADVPVTISSGTFSITRRMRLAGFATVTDRILTEAQPTSVSVNDGSVPETRTSLHTRTLNIRDKDAVK